MIRLVSPRLHHLPQQLTPELAPYSSGNRNAEVLAKLKAIWHDDALVDSHLRQHSGSRRRDGRVPLRARRAQHCRDGFGH